MYRLHDHPSLCSTTSNLPPLGGAEHYVGRGKLGDAWVSFGTLAIGSDGRSLSVAENDALARAPEEVRVTRESGEGDGPVGAVVIAAP